MDFYAPLSNPASSDTSLLSDLVKEAKKRFERCSKWEYAARKRWLDDYKFYNADAYNGYQWPNEIRRSRDVDERPCVTINKARQHCLQIINDEKKNKPSIKIRATGGGATYESAQVYNSIMRHIEYQSQAQDAYRTATEFQVSAGLGWIRVTTDYMDENSFDQEARIELVKD